MDFGNSGVRGQGSGAGGQGSAVRGQGSGARGPGPGVRGQGSGATGASASLALTSLRVTLHFGGIAGCGGKLPPRQPAGSRRYGELLEDAVVQFLFAPVGGGLDEGQD